MISRVEFAGKPPEPIRLAWRDWLRHHTIDPDMIPVDGFIEVDFDAYQIRYLSFDLNEQGCRYYDLAMEGVAKSVRILQLDARPSPFPGQ